jgi:hypothetical protein
MDLKALKEQALLATGRFFHEKFGAAPAEDSEEWEDEYRRQFNRLTKAAPSGPATAAPLSTIVEEKPVDLPDLAGTSADARWAFALRAARLKQIQNHDLRAWLARTWIRAKEWIDTRDLATDAFQRRVEPSYQTARRQSAAEAAATAATRQAQATAAAALQTEIKAAGISAAGLVELIDVSPRAAAVPIKDKLTELRLDDRSLRVFETANPAILMVLEKRGDQKAEYGIERDAGLVADLKLFARSGL